MEELETAVRHRLQHATDTELSPDFWNKVERHARSARRRRFAGRSMGAAAAAAAAAIFAVTSSLPGSGDPSLPVLGDVAVGPSQPTEVRDGVLGSGERWQLSVAGPEAWPQAQGEAGEICTRIVYDEGQAGHLINCAPPNPELQLPDSLDRLFVIRDYEAATTLELELPGRSATAPMQILRTGRFPVTWAIADISQLPDFADVERLVIKDVDGNELWSINGPAS